MAQDEDQWGAVEEAAELMLEGEFELALRALRAVLEADPRNAYAYNYLGATCYELGRHVEARDAFRAAVRLAPDYLGARVGLSQVLRDLGDAEASLDEAEEALRRFPGDADALYAAALAHAALGQNELARRRLHAFLETGPEFEVQAEVQALLERLATPRRRDVPQA
ncbi:MAG: tetratricopeptide repeat protein [Polyangiaceae bacterium]|nr:tetratricopeptide repeat protein [Polyangiaceae bacterium]